MSVLMLRLRCVPSVWGSECFTRYIARAGLVFGQGVGHPEGCCCLAEVRQGCKSHHPKVSNVSPDAGASLGTIGMRIRVCGGSARVIPGYCRVHRPRGLGRPGDPVAWRECCRAPNNCTASSDYVCPHPKTSLSTMGGPTLGHLTTLRAIWLPGTGGLCQFGGARPSGTAPGLRLP